MRLLPLFLFLLPILVSAQTAGQRLDLLLDEITTYEESLHPADGSGPVPISAFPLLSVADYQETLVRYSDFLRQLEGIAGDSLNRDQVILSQLLQHKLNNEIDQIQYERYLVPMNAEGGFYQSFPYARRAPRLRSTQDYQDYLTYLGHYTDWLESRLELLRLGIEKGIVAPKPVIRNALALMDGWYPEDPEVSPYYSSFKTAPEDLPGIDEIKKEGQEIILLKINPFYQDLRRFLTEEYMPASANLPGVIYQSGGTDYYASRMRYFTTLPMTADSVHALGRKEVARIRKRMETIIDSLGFSEGFDAFLAFLRSDEQFYAKTPQELLHRAAWLSKRAEAKLPAYFQTLYSLPFTVEPVPDNIAPTYTGGRYVPGSWRSQRAGIYWVNTYKLESRPFYTLPALTLHEAVPGHHLQIMYTAELNNLSDFRRNYYISAFGEGWGLYSEFLGEEMGIYTTPYDMFGRLTYEMWRACRLVVDTGIHSMGWSREQAVEYLAGNTALSLHEVNTEIDRYIGWPGQAVSYKIGELKIKSLRQQAEKELGDNFDIRKFHEVILRNGSVPLTVLEEEVTGYIYQTLAENRSMGE